MGRPVLFRQRRVGMDGKEFTIFKFRSMRGVGEPGAAIGSCPTARGCTGRREGADRRTRLRRVPAADAIDELPQLFNVLRGDMSLVGPRPERPGVRGCSTQLYRYADRHRVKSGITGWAQVHGLRGKTSLADRVEWDNHYIENWSPWLDMKILMLTVAAMFRDSPE